MTKPHDRGGDLTMANTDAAFVGSVPELFFTATRPSRKAREVGLSKSASFERHLEGRR
jgi:hypothetical protein